MQIRPSSITGSWSPASRTSKSLSLQRHLGEECGRYWIHCRRHRGAVARILVMDDDGMLRGAIRIALEAAGYEVLEAADGHAGLRLQREQGDDLVLVDIFMPERDGLEVIRALRPSIPNRRSSPCRVGAGPDKSRCWRPRRRWARRARWSSRSNHVSCSR